MVVFCCSVCCESLKKNQVQKHYSRCRMNMVSCMDCSTEFWNDDYQQHIKCISEEEKYSGKDYKPRPGQNKGEVKQDAWLQQVQKAIDSSSPSPKLRDLLERMKDYPNIPRKQAKFLNFIKNSLRISDPKLGRSVWEILMSAAPPKEEIKANGKENQDNQNNEEEKNVEKNVKEEEEDEEEELKPMKNKLSKREKKEERRKGQTKMEKKDGSKKQKHNSDDENVDDGVEKNQENNRLSKKKAKKRKEEEYFDGVQQQNGQETKKKKKSNKKQKDNDEEDGMPPLEPNLNHVGFEEEEEEEEEEEDSPPQKKKQNKHFNWEQIILTLLTKTKEKTMSEKKLRKKVFAEYMNEGGHMDSMSLLKAKFDRKIKKNPQFVRQKDQVRLID